MLKSFKGKIYITKTKNNWLQSCICLKLQFYIIILNLRIFKPCVDKLQDCFNNINIRIMYVIKFYLYKRNKIYMISLKMQMTTPPPPHKKKPYTHRAVSNSWPAASKVNILINFAALYGSCYCSKTFNISLTST